jgi:hypothetical protein
MGIACMLRAPVDQQPADKRVQAQQHAPQVEQKFPLWTKTSSAGTGRRSPATLPAHGRGRSPRNKGLR